MTYVIAEAGSTHDGNLQNAFRLVDLADTIKANAVKFQWVSDPKRLAERRHADAYLGAYQVISFPREWHADLQAYARSLGLDYLCTVYLPEDIAVVAPYVDRFKIASFEAGDPEFVQAHRKWPKQIIMSLGMAAYSAPWPDVKRLHCVSAYPTPLDQINLARVRGLDGLSDHTKHPMTGALAVACGAEIIEFHIRLDASDPLGADFNVARNPREAAEYTTNIRLAELMMGTGAREVMSAEEPMLRYRVTP